MTLDDYLKLIQIAFYATAGCLAFLTYVKAKDTLLNSVNTEYHKRVIQRLGELSEELLTEFDPQSSNYWSKKQSVGQITKRLHEEALKYKDEIIKSGKFPPGIPISEEELWLDRFVTRIKSDPFLPKEIRDKIHELFDARLDVMTGAHVEEIEKYKEALARGEYWDSLDTNEHWLHNKILTRMYEQGCGVSQIEEEIHNLRLFIQEYLEQFNPIKRHWRSRKVIGKGRQQKSERPALSVGSKVVVKDEG